MSPAAYDPRILVAIPQGSRPSPLDEADHLASFDGIVFEPLWHSFHGGALPYHAPPGHVATVVGRVGEFSDRQVANTRRSDELRAFLVRGGVLVVRVREPVGLRSSQGVLLDTYGWIIRAIAPELLRPSRYVLAAMPSKGADVSVVDEYHPMAEAIRTGGGYEARLADELLALDGARALAENRAGEPVAAEIPVGRGAVVLVPAAGVNAAETEAALRSMLRERPPLTEPELTEERALDSEAEVIREEMEVRLADVRSRRRQLLARKQAVLELDRMQRARGHLRRALAPTASARTVFSELYSLLEIVVKAVGGGRRDVATTLGVPYEVLDLIGEYGNQDEHGLRHTTPEALEPLPSGVLGACREHGRTLLRSFLDYEMAARNAPVPPS